MRLVLLTIIFLTAAHCTAHAQQAAADSIRAIISREVAGKRSKSIVVGIINANGRQIYSDGKMSDDNPVLPDGNTIYEIGSITKVFTSLLLADMSLKNEVSLTDPISKYLPKTVKTPVWAGKEISLLSLSTHRAGFPRNAYNIDPEDLDNPFADYGEDKLYEYVSTFDLFRAVDSKWEYSNIGYALLGHILTIAAKTRFDSLLQQRICRPLNMSSTVISLTPEMRKRAAQGHSETGMPVLDLDFELAGGGGLRSSANDMLTFAAAQLGFTETALQPAMQLSHVKQAKKDGNDSYTTMGWSLRDDGGRLLLYKDGGTAGFRTFLGIDKVNKYAVVVLANSNNLVTDIGLHILDSAVKVKQYPYQWALLDTLRSTVAARGVDAGLAVYQTIKAAGYSQRFVFNEFQLDQLGGELRRAGRINDAIKVYEVNKTDFYKSPLVYESLGETYKRYKRGKKNRQKAIEYFDKAFTLDSSNPHWPYIIKKLK